MLRQPRKAAANRLGVCLGWNNIPENRRAKRRADTRRTRVLLCVLAAAVALLAGGGLLQEFLL